MLTLAKWQRYLFVKKQRPQYPLSDGTLREYAWGGTYKVSPVEWASRGYCWLEVRQGRQTVMFRWSRWADEESRIGEIFKVRPQLEAMSTVELLALRRTCYACGSARLRHVYATIDDIKDVLATRPHIRNKKEAKAYRREMATKNRGRKR